MSSPSQPPEGLRSAIHHAIYESLDCLTFQQARTIRDAVLAALFAACEVREHPHMWLGDNTRTGRALVLRYPLPDEPIPPAPEGLAELIRSRIGAPPQVPVIPDDEEENSNDATV